MFWFTFLLSQIHTPSLPINWPSLVSTARSPVILWRYSDLINLRTNTIQINIRPKHLYVRSDQFCDERKQKAYLVWEMYWLLYLINTTSTAPIRSCIRGRTQFFKIVGFAGKRFLLSPPPPPLRRLLGKESGSRKQVYLWQVGKASQWQYYLVKILQVNVFFTLLKIARRLPIFSTIINNEILRNFEGKNHGLLHGILKELSYVRKTLLL